MLPEFTIFFGLAIYGRKTARFFDHTSLCTRRPTAGRNFQNCMAWICSGTSWAFLFQAEKIWLRFLVVVTFLVFLN